jgi:hypothetical protein
MAYMHTKYIPQTGSYGMKTHGVCKYGVQKYSVHAKGMYMAYMHTAYKNVCIKFKENLNNYWKPYVRRPWGGRSAIAHLVTK